MLSRVLSDVQWTSLKLGSHMMSYAATSSASSSVSREKYHPDLLPLVKHVKMLLPKMHIHGHKEVCQAVYAICYAQGFGHNHGEGIETPWADMNAAGRPTREMTSGARVDTLVGLFNFWNWRKTEQMGMWSGTQMYDALLKTQ